MHHVEKYGRTREATDDNMAYAHYMRYTYGYKHTLGICCTYYFSTAKMRPSVVLFVHCFVSLKFLSLFQIYIQFFLLYVLLTSNLNTCIFAVQMPSPCSKPFRVVKQPFRNVNLILLQGKMTPSVEALCSLPSVLTWALNSLKSAQVFRVCELNPAGCRTDLKF
jgi:hypothetical protein